MSERRTVVITGASRGIGLAAARAFANLGDRVYGLSRSQGPTIDGVTYISVDLSDGAQIEAAFDRIDEETGRIDVVVANAGITKDQLTVRMSDDDFRIVIETNLVATFQVMRRSLKKMMRQRSGRIVCVSSIGAYIGLPGQANYAASKAGVIGMARAMAREVASRGVTVNVVAPGLIDTDMTSVLGEEKVEAMAAQIPAGRLGTADEVAGSIVFLASETAAYITGAILAVDGGMGMGL
jgi:3-oxoacyl-[acyl-carrier protein] reductase